MTDTITAAIRLYKPVEMPTASLPPPTTEEMFEYMFKSLTDEYYLVEKNRDSTNVLVTCENMFTPGLSDAIKNFTSKYLGEYNPYLVVVNVVTNHGVTTPSLFSSTGGTLQLSNQDSE